MKEYVADLIEHTNEINFHIETALDSDCVGVCSFVEMASYEFMALGGKFEFISQEWFNAYQDTAEWGRMSEVLLGRNAKGYFSQNDAMLNESEKEYLLKLQELNKSFVEELESFEKKNYFWPYQTKALSELIFSYKEQLDNLVKETYVN